ncbi:MAG: hypothetical protein QOF85_2606 [Solirubrobacterales bacterium]|nr:hypothetical protein [Solirubrobacterales bacterium]
MACGHRGDFDAATCRAVRRAPGRLILDEFHRRLLEESKQTPFPAPEIDRALRPYARARSRG